MAKQIVLEMFSNFLIRSSLRYSLTYIIVYIAYSRPQECQRPNVNPRIFKMYSVLSFEVNMKPVPKTIAGLVVVEGLFDPTCSRVEFQLEKFPLISPSILEHPFCTRRELSIFNIFNIFESFCVNRDDIYGN